MAVERRAAQADGVDRLFDFMRELQDDVRLFSSKLQHLDDALVRHMHHEEKAMKDVADKLQKTDDVMAEVSAKINTLSQIQIAFPHEDGEPDLIEHRIFHEKKNREEEDSREIKLEGKKVVTEVVIKWTMYVAQAAFMMYVLNHFERIV